MIWLPRGNWSANHSRVFSEQKKKEEIWAEHNEHKEQTGSLIKHQAHQRNLSPYVGESSLCFSMLPSTGKQVLCRQLVLMSIHPLIWQKTSQTKQQNS
jgi:hypothetical protein